MRQALAAACVLALMPAPVRGGAAHETPKASAGVHVFPAAAAPPASEAPSRIAPATAEVFLNPSAPLAGDDTGRAEAPASGTLPAPAAAPIPSIGILPAFEDARSGPAPVPGESAVADLDAAFDGRPATSKDVLARLPS